MKKHHMPPLLSVFIVLILTPAIVYAQAANNCPALVNRALSQLGTTCAGVARNNACYGNNQLTTHFVNPVPADFFTHAGDQTPLNDVEAIQATSADVQAETWGISVLHLQANLPNTLPGQGVVLISLGGTEVENGVDPNEALILPTQPLTVTTSGAAEFRVATSTSPSSSEIIGYIPQGASLQADATSADGNWVRVIYNNRPGWINRPSLAANVDVSTLPSIGPETFTPMQSFYFRTGIGGVECNDAPPLILIQGPSDIPVDIRVHDVDIRIESTILLRTLPLGDTLGNQFQLITLYGLATINPNSNNPIYVPPGFEAHVGLGEFVSLGIEGDADEKSIVGNWSTPRPLTQAELTALGLLNRLPSNLLNYTFRLPTLIRPSGVGGPIPRLIFADPRALAAVRRACTAGQIPANICTMLLG
jgi:hypothetical protein